MSEQVFNQSSFDPSMRGDLAGTIRYVLDKFLQNTDDMLPAQVLAFDRASNRVSVQPLISIVTTNGDIVQRAPIQSLPVFQFGGGGFVISFPIAIGDLGWIKASDRDTSLFLQTVAGGSAASSQPNTARKHSFSDALFIPDTMLKGVTIAGEDANNLVIQNLAGTVKISWWANLLKIIAPSVGIGGTPNANAVLDLQSTTKAFILPRMSTSQKTAIPSPAMGMVVYDTTTLSISSYNGVIWS